MKNIVTMIHTTIAKMFSFNQATKVVHTLALTLCILGALSTAPTAEAAEQHIWVANAGSNTVSKVDITTDSVVATIPVGSYPYAVAVSEDHVFVANRDSKSISFIEKATDLVYATVELDRHPLAVSLGADGYLYAVVSLNTIGYTSSNTSYLYRIDPTTFTKVNELTLRTISGLDIGIGVNSDNIAYLPYNYSWSMVTGIMIVDLNTFTMQGHYNHSPTTWGYLGPGVTVDSEGNGWASGRRVNGQQSIIKITPSGARSYYGRSYGNREELVLDPDGYLWGSNAPNPLIKFNTADATYTTYSASSWTGGTGSVSGLTYLGGYIWVVDQGNNYLRKIDPADGSEVAAIPVGSSPYSIGDISGYEAAMQGLSITLPSDIFPLELNLSSSGTLAAAGDKHYYRLDLYTGGFFQLALDDADDIGSTELYVKCGSFPNAYAYDASSTNPDSPDQELVFSTDQAQTCYVLVEGVDAAQEYTLLASQVEVGISDITPNYYGNTQGARLTISGTGFDGQTAVSLIASNGTHYSPQIIEVDSLYQITAYFDLTDVPIGRYDVQVVSQSGDGTLTNGFEVIETQQANLETHLVLPGSFGRHATATIYVEYKNSGNVAMPAPMLLLVSADPDGSDKPILTLDSSKVMQNFWSSSLPSGSAHTVQFLADGDEDSPGILQPGESGRMPVYYSGLKQPWNFSDNKVEFELRIVKADEPALFDWETAKVDFKPENIDQEAWEIIFANLSNGIGDTWGDYIAMLSENADYLYRHSQQHIRDIEQLFQFEMMQAMGHGTVPYLAVQTDIVVAAPGLDISFTRYLPSSVSQRFFTGPLARGWTHSWEISASENDDGNVIITRMNNRSQYQLDSRGGYFAPAGNYAELTKSNDLFTLTQPDGLVETFRADGKIDSVADRNNNRISAEYDSNDQLNRLVHSSGQYLSFAYDGSGNITGITDHTGSLAVTYAYDASQEYLTAVTGTSGTTTSYSYYQEGAATHALGTIQHPDGTWEYMAYDENGRISELQHNETPSVFFTYDIGEVVITAEADQSVREMFYDVNGRFVKYKDPLQQTTTSEFDSNHNLTQINQADGSTISLTYDANGNLVQLVDPLQQTIGFTYSSLGRLSSVTDPKHNTTIYNYDNLANPESTVSADGTTEYYTTDGLGTMDQLVNRRATPINYNHDESGRLLRKEFADGSFVEYSYDLAGNVVSVIEPAGATTMTYTINNLLQRITYPDGKFLEYGYDGAGRRTSMLDQSGYQLNYTYDLNGQLQNIVDSGARQIVAYTYDIMQRLSRKELGNGVFTIYEYDIAGRLAKVSNFAADSSLLSFFEYGFDSLGRRSSMATVDGVWTYGYDLAGQLTQANFVSSNGDLSDKTISYTYDQTGNRIEETVDGSTANYTTNSMNQYSQAGTFSYSYDADGNLISKTDGVDVWSYTYNDENRLVAMSGPDGATEYHYNGLGHLTGTTENGITKQYLVDPVGIGNVVGEYDGSNTLLSRYTHGLGLLGKDDYYYTFDGSGNTSELTDTTNQIVNAYGYEPFGSPLYSTEEVDNDFQFVGQFGVMKADDDLYFMRNRFYSSAMGRFTSEDPINLAGGDVSLYRYVQNDPVNFIDPVGLLSTGQNFAIGAAGTTVSMAAMSSVALAPAAPFLGGLTAAGLTLAAGGSVSEATWNGLTAAFGGPLFGWAVKGMVGAEGLVMAGLGDYMLDLIWADQPPPWESALCP